MPSSQSPSWRGTRVHRPLSQSRHPRQTRYRCRPKKRHPSFSPFSRSVQPFSYHSHALRPPHIRRPNSPNYPSPQLPPIPYNGHPYVQSCHHPIDHPWRLTFTSTAGPPPNHHLRPIRRRQRHAVQPSLRPTPRHILPVRLAHHSDPTARRSQRCGLPLRVYGRL